MVWHLSSIWVLILDFAAWFAISIGVSYSFYRIADVKFTQDDWLTKPRAFERTNALYKKTFFIMRWKSLLPDGSGILRKGFQKKRLLSNEESYLNQFVLESRRAEWTHVVSILFIPLFLLWNTWIDEAIITLYGLVVNVPCILAQRYNRFRLTRVIARMQRLRSPREWI